MKLPENYKTLVVIAVVIVGALVVLFRNPSEAPSTPIQAPGSAFVPKEAGPPELALVAPLKKGEKLLDYEITAINGVEHGVIEILLANPTKGPGIVTLTVALASDAGPLAPVTAGPYALFVSRGRETPAEDGTKLVDALLAIVKANVGAPVPPGLSSYKVEARPQASAPR